jgi:hypothetical protein
MNLGLGLWWIDMMENGLKDIKVPHDKCMEKTENHKNQFKKPPLA